MKRIRKLGERRRKRSNVNEQTPPSSHNVSSFHFSLKKNIEHIQKTLGESSDIVIREFKAGVDGSMHLAVFYTDGLADKAMVQDFIIEPLMFDIRQSDLTSDAFQNKSHLDILKTFSIASGDMVPIKDFDIFFQHVLSGDTAILIDGDAEGVAIGSRGWEDRGVNEPTSQTVIRGPKDGFTETLRTNTALIRRKIKDPNLWIETKTIGAKTHTDVALIYLNGVVEPELVDEVRERLSRITIDGILESANIEEHIQDETYSPFPTIFNSERPDTVAAGILEGRIAIVIDGTPFVLLVPALFVQFFQSSEDYYQRFDQGVLIRLLRYISFFLALLTPSAYIAVTTFHQEMLPTPLLISLAAQREGIPFPALIEAILMELTFEILREAGVRMPRAVGSAISIVGALVLGQAAVEAGIVSNAMVIVVSITAISSFVMPAFNMAISVRILRFPFMILAATFGLFGIILGLIAMVLHLCGLRSFGAPYMSPMAPLIMNDQKDAIIRAPLWSLSSRPAFMSENKTRNQTPSPKPDSK
ncbi:spore germination protein [Pseudalkalibacillus hwajinpoensis]|uniref:Spore germination protein n=1 Tax=Guptibacillus hwajinpoensis TaxID=208199 RepID=A0A4U1MMT1_9BACL|nr:spore germination protein [Pseudalkalibacillus hwajinpoensis]TKD72094.1 spore germination protein [Pseudalkalibacillus hwajinpoensis]